MRHGKEALSFMWNSRSAIQCAALKIPSSINLAASTLCCALHFASIAGLNVSLSLYTKMGCDLLDMGRMVLLAL
jgi:hypothetical protein